MSEIDEIGGARRRRVNQPRSSVGDMSKLTASTTQKKKRRRQIRRDPAYHSPKPSSFTVHRSAKYAYENPYPNSINNRRRA